jgi:hypothetical protein
MNILLAFLQAFSFLGAAYFCGTMLVFSMNKTYKSNLYNAFVTSLLGAFFLVSLFAVMATGGNTVLMLFFILALAVYWFLCKKQNNTQSEVCCVMPNSKKIGYEITIIGLLTISFAFVYGLQFYHQPMNLMPHGDYYYYSKLIYSMINNGLEANTFVINPFHEGQAGAMPYHYPELWLAAIFYKVFNTMPLEGLIIQTQIVLSVIAAVGLFALGELITKSKAVFIVTIALMFFGGIAVLNILEQTRSFTDFGIAYTPKYTVIAIFFIWGSLLLVQKSLHFYIPFLLLPIINIALAPAIFTVLTLYFIGVGYFNKSWSMPLKPMFFIFGTALSIAIFYIAQRLQPSALLTTSDLLTIHLNNPFKIVQILGGALFIFINVNFIYFAPLLVLLISKKRMLFITKLFDYKWLLFFFGLILIVSAAIWSVMHPMHDSVQFFYLPTFLFFYVFLFVLWSVGFEIVIKFKKLKYLYLAVIGFVIVVNLYHQKDRAFSKFVKVENYYSQQYLADIIPVVNSLVPHKIGALLHPTKQIYTSFDAFTYGGVMPPLDNKIAAYNLVNLSSMDFKIMSNDPLLLIRAQQFLKISAFTDFYKELRIENPPISIDSAQYVFVKENKLRYMVVYNGAIIPSVFNQIIDTVFIDSVSGEKFCLFK